MEYWNTRLADVPVSKAEFIEYFSVRIFLLFLFGFLGY